MDTCAFERGQPEKLPLTAEQILRQVKEHAMFLVDRHGRLASWNEGAQKVFGYPQEEWLGLPLSALFTPEDRADDVPSRELKTAADVGVAEDDRWMLRQGGARFYASGTLTQVCDEEGRAIGFFKVVRDRTEPLLALKEKNRLFESEREAREEAERQAAALAAAIDAIPDGVYIGDVNGIVRCNRPALEMLDAADADEATVRVEQMSRFRLRRERGGELLPAEELPYTQALSGRTVVTESWALKESTSEDVFVRVTAAPIVFEGDIVGAVAVCSDLTERLELDEKKSRLSHVETALREREEQLRAVFVGVRDYAIFTVDLEGRISSWHEGAALMKGYTAEEAIGMPFANLFVHEDRDRGRPRMEMDVAAATGEYKGDGKRLRANGEFFDAAVVLTALRGPQGQLLGYLKLTQDITDRRRQEREREELLANAEAARVEAERISHAMSEFLATISHELRTPLNAIVGWAHMLERGAPDASTLQQGLAAITRNSRAQVQLIEDLLDMNRIESGELRLEVQPVVPASIIAKAIDAVLPAAEAKDIALSTVLDPRAGIVSADPDRLLQIIWNLVTNAVKFTPRGGRVTLAVMAKKGEVEVSVTDTGQGIPADFIERMFNRFQQQDASTTRRHGGLGIGLSIARQLARLHGGDIHAESTGPNQGSTFTLTLPLLKESSPPPAAPDHAPEQADDGARPQPLRGIATLLIDDEADTRDVVSRLIRQAGGDVVVAADAEQGLTLLRSERPKVVLCDIGMPEHDGYDFIRRLRALPADEGGHTPAAAFTAFTRDEDRERALKLGYHTHLSKPIVPDTLIEAVASLAKIAR